MNDFLSLAQKRYAVRSYLPKPVEAEKLERILEAGRAAPTAKNNQPHKFLVVQQAEGLEKLSKCTNVQGYPLAIIVCGVPSEAWVRPYDGKGCRSGFGKLLDDPFRSLGYPRAFPHPRRHRA